MKWNDRLYRLQFITRYSNIPRVRDENVAQHSFFVASICLELMNGMDGIDREKVLTMAIVHDWAEADIDDIAHNIKRDYPKVKEALKEAELEAMSVYPDSILIPYIEYEEGQSKESMIVKLADTIQCVQYLEHEISLGNKFMEPLLVESKSYVMILTSKLGLHHNLISL